MKRGRVPVTLSVPSELATKFARLAKAEAKNRSQLFREMVSVYEQHSPQLYWLASRAEFLHRSVQQKSVAYYKTSPRRGLFFRQSEPNWFLISSPFL
jgi:Ribbon-helix-helix protein, copG family